MMVTVLSLLFFLLLPLSSLSTTTNECGGVRPLREKVDTLCETNIQGACPFGRLACASRESLKCTPVCTLTLLDVHTSICVECRNNGSYSLEDRRCLCKRGYSGDLCEIEDYCRDKDCGLFGTCSSSEQRCLCKSGFSGDHCEINDECSGYAFEWDGRTCRCTENFDGLRCDRCSADLICIPGKDVYVLARIANKYLVEKLLNATLFDESRAAYRPTIDVNQLCTCQSLSMLSPTTSSLMESYDDDNEEQIVIVDDGVVIAYIDGVYRREYEHQANENVSFYILLLLFLISVISILAIFACFAGLFYISERPIYEKNRKLRR